MGPGTYGKTKGRPPKKGKTTAAVRKKILGKKGKK